MLKVLLESWLEFDFIEIFDISSHKPIASCLNIDTIKPIIQISTMTWILELVGVINVSEVRIEFYSSVLA